VVTNREAGGFGLGARQRFVSGQDKGQRAQKDPMSEDKNGEMKYSGEEGRCTLS
jgi:hypothetical protein